MRILLGLRFAPKGSKRDSGGPKKFLIAA